MSLDIKIKKKSKSPLDVNELFPNYFTKNIFRTFVVLMVLLLLVVFVTNGYTLKFSYIECPETALNKCILNESYNFETRQIEYTYLEAGEVIGNKPNNLGHYFNKLVLLLTVLAFLVNHSYYYYRTRNIFIPFNKEKWRTIENEYFRDDIKER